MKLFPGFALCIALRLLFLEDVQVFIHFVSFLAVGYVAEGEIVADFHISIALHSLAATAVQTGGVAVYLILGHDVHTSGTGSLAAGTIIS